MKAVKTLVLLTALFFSFINSKAQANTAVASEKAILFADSLLKSFRSGNFEQYTALSYPGVISYYGGKKSFSEYIQRTRFIHSNTVSENLRLIQMLNVTSEWQCVIEKTGESLIDGKKAKIISYMVGQSIDEGQSWKFFDVSFNPVSNLVYIMPDIFSTLTIPQRQVVYVAINVAGNM